MRPKPAQCPSSTCLCTPEGGKQTKLSLVTGTSRERERERGRRRRWSDNFLCSVWQMFLFCFLCIFLHCWWSCCALSGHERGRGGREVCLSAIFPLILSRFVACFIHFFLVFFFTSCPVYLRVCVGVRVSVCVCECTTTQTGSNMQIKQRPSATSIKWERDTKAREHRRRMG